MSSTSTGKGSCSQPVAVALNHGRVGAIFSDRRHNHCIKGGCELQVPLRSPQMHASPKWAQTSCRSLS
jgi:hypothetical protein